MFCLLPLTLSAEPLLPVFVNQEKNGFVLGETQREFRIWGFNYDRDDKAEGSRLLEDYWDTEWETVSEHFAEIAALGANVVRIHLQYGKFMSSPDSPYQSAFDRLGALVDLAETHQLRLLITGLGCYRKDDVPPWYDTLSESERWQAQANFWRVVTKTCLGKTSILGFDLMNEPIIGGDVSEGWLTGELGGSYFVQRLTLEQGGRSSREIAAAWVKTLTKAIREEDPTRLITVGVIPWAIVWPNVKPVFYAPEIVPLLDFASIHVYPDAGKVDAALQALETYQVGIPLVITEMFPLKCSLDELDQFIDRSAESVSGWVGFYWGKSIEAYKAEDTLASKLTAEWLSYFKEEANKRVTP